LWNPFFCWGADVLQICHASFKVLDHRPPPHGGVIVFPHYLSKFRRRPVCCGSPPEPLFYIPTFCLCDSHGTNMVTLLFPRDSPPQPPSLVPFVTLSPFRLDFSSPPSFFVLYLHVPPPSLTQINLFLPQPSFPKDRQVFFPFETYLNSSWRQWLFRGIAALRGWPPPTH